MFQDGSDDLALSAEEFDAFYHSHGPRLWGYLLGASRDEALASDILQEALLRFLRSAPRDIDEGKRRAYLFRIASNLLRDAWRARRREEPLLEESSEDEAVVDEAGGASTASDALRIDLSRDLDRALRSLRGVERKLVWLAHVEGFSHRELADVLGLQEGSVKVLLFRARRKLAALLAPARVHAEGERS